MVDHHGSPRENDDAPAPAFGSDLTADEETFLLRYTSLTPTDLTAAGRERTVAAVAAARVAARALRITDAYSLGDVAVLLGVTYSYVQAQLDQGDLIGARDQRGDTYLPRWQFTVTGHTIPSLREVLHAFPNDWDVHDVTAFMTAASEELDGRTPEDWLKFVADPDRVISLASDMGRI